MESHNNQWQVVENTKKSQPTTPVLQASRNGNYDVHDPIQMSEKSNDICCEDSPVKPTHQFKHKIGCKYYKKHCPVNSSTRTQLYNKTAPTERLPPSRGDPNCYTSNNTVQVGQYRRIFTLQERAIHKQAINAARTKVLKELQVSKEWIKNKLNELMYSIDPRTQTPYNGFFESFIRLRKFAQGTEIDDIIVVDGFKFSRDHFYQNFYFQADLVDYYWNLLLEKDSYHKVKVVYYNDKPHLKIEYKMMLKPGLAPEDKPEPRSNLSELEQCDSEI